jgi:hypothetical protein
LQASRIIAKPVFLNRSIDRIGDRKRLHEQDTSSGNRMTACV